MSFGLLVILPRPGRGPDKLRGSMHTENALNAVLGRTEDVQLIL